MDPLQLPPERDLPDADRMLARILDDRPARRSVWPLAAVAAVGLVAIGAGAAVVLHRPGTTAVPAGPASPASTSTPSRDATGKAAASTDAEGVRHLAGPGTAQFDHFRVTVSDAPTQRMAGQWSRRVSVCVVRLGPNPVNGRTRISWDPWSAQQGTTSLTPLTAAARQQPALPFDELYAPGTCATGYLTFAGDPSQPTVLRYTNSYGEQAVWTLEP